MGFLDELGKKLLIFDGGMGTMIQAAGLPAGALPELWNILKGDMSIVGPRPLLVEYLPYYTQEERHRHDVRPGLTGLAQVNGRNNLTWEQKFAYDLEYVAELSFAKDVQIICQTVGKVIKKSDIAVGDQYKGGKFLDQRRGKHER